MTSPYMSPLFPFTLSSSLVFLITTLVYYILLVSSTGHMIAKNINTIKFQKWSERKKLDIRERLNCQGLEINQKMMTQGMRETVGIEAALAEENGKQIEAASEVNNSYACATDDDKS
ncbi:hypothetical protein L2E82_43784 [Cichorium intybus]|uniref:Uncharacterized protein n=1 Tax=Cichorium intybus TaxID=13427 RepID=A0ACB8ZP22_CICIN|nr:hypothetical protein L2E82_43784 [Cichorium intybus]